LLHILSYVVANDLFGIPDISFDIKPAHYDEAERTFEQ
jgi:hypothetical protein